MGLEGWPKQVWYRFDSTLIKFKLNGDGFPEVIVKDSVNLKDLTLETFEYMMAPIEDRPVLLLDLSEEEVNPMTHIPTLVLPSNRDVYEVTKEFRKSNQSVARKLNS